MPSLKAQFHWGFEAGYVNNQMNASIDNQAFTKIKNGSGVGLGISGKYEFNYISFETGIQYLQKNYEYVRTGNFTGLFTTFANAYLQLPALISFQVYKKEKFTIEVKAGGYGGYWISSTIKGNIPDMFSIINRTEDEELLQYLGTEAYREKVRFNSLKDNRFEIGCAGGLSAQYEISKHGNLLLNFKYYQSITDQQKNYMIRQTGRYNQTIFISMGYSTKF